MESNSFIQKKRGREFRNNIEVLDDNNKKIILKALNKIRKDSYYKDIFHQYQKLIDKLNSHSIEDIINLSDSKDLEKLIGFNSIELLSKSCNGYLTKIKNTNEIIKFYNIPKIVGSIFNPKKIEIDICYSNSQLNQINSDIADYDSTIYSLEEEDLTSLREISAQSNEFLIVLNNKINLEINEENPKNLFDPYNFGNKIEDPLVINKGFFYYFDIPIKFQDNYVYIKTKKREKFIEFLSNFIENDLFGQYLILTGPKGIGKSTTLLYLSGLNYYNIFYFNFQATQKQSFTNTKKILKLEIIKLFGKYYNFNNEFIKNILKSIDYFDPNSTYDFLLKIAIDISSFIQSEKIKKSFFLILDQYYDKIEFNIQSFLKKIEQYKNIRIILCSNLNNDFSKKLILDTIDPYKNPYENKFKIHYFPKLIIENEEFELFFYKEKDKYLKKFKEFGGLPIFYFLLKEEEKDNIELFINYIVKDIIKEINDKDYISIIVELLALIKSNCLLSSNKLKEILAKIPINYITIKKRDIWFQNQTNFSSPFKYYLNDINIKEDNKSEKKIFSNGLDYEKKNENNDYNNNKWDIKILFYCFKRKGNLPDKYLLSLRRIFRRCIFSK